jgi:hypothetical protein
MLAAVPIARRDRKAPPAQEREGGA